MGLPASQRRTLESIERRLRAREPKLASMFSIFTHLTQNEVLPSTEAISDRPWFWLTGRLRRRAAVSGRPRRAGSVRLNRVFGAAFVPFALLVLATTALVIGGLSAPSGRCAHVGTRYSVIKAGFAPSYCSPRAPTSTWRRSP